MGTVFYLVLEVLPPRDLQGFAYCVFSNLFISFHFISFSPLLFHSLTHFSGEAIHFLPANPPPKLSLFSFLTFSRHPASLLPDFYSLVHFHLPKNLSFGLFFFSLILISHCSFLIYCHFLGVFFILFVDVVMAGVPCTRSAMQSGNTLSFG